MSDGWGKLMDVVNIAADIGVSIANQNNQLKMLELQENARIKREQTNREFRTAEKPTDRAWSEYSKTKSLVETYKKSILEKGYSIPDQFQTEGGQTLLDGTYQEYVDLNKNSVNELAQLTKYMDSLNQVSDVATKTEEIAGAARRVYRRSL